MPIVVARWACGRHTVRPGRPRIQSKSCSPSVRLRNPHYLRAENPLISQFDVFGDKFLNDPNHASHSYTQSHDHSSNILADLATQHGILNSIENVPFADSHSQRRTDLVTCREGLVHPNPPGPLNFGLSTLLVMDFELARGHVYTRSPRINSNHRTLPTWSITNDSNATLLTLSRAWHLLLSCPFRTLTPRLRPKQLFDICEVLSMCRPRTGSWLLFMKG